MKYYIKYGGSQEPVRNNLFEGLNNIDTIAGNNQMYEITFRGSNIELTIIPDDDMYNVSANENIFSEFLGGAAGFRFVLNGDYNEIRVTRNNLREILETMNSPYLTNNDLTVIEQHLREIYSDAIIRRIPNQIIVTFENGIIITISYRRHFYSVLSSRILFSDTDGVSLETGTRNIIYLDNVERVYDAILAIHSIQVPEVNEERILPRELNWTRFEPSGPLERSRREPYWSRFGTFAPPIEGNFTLGLEPPTFRRQSPVRQFSPVRQSSPVRSAESLEPKLIELKEQMMSSDFAEQIKDTPQFELFKKFVEQSVLQVQDKFVEIGSRCPVCLDNIKNVALVPCGHRLCSMCHHNLTNNPRRTPVCPECRKEIVASMNLYGGQFLN